MRMRTSEKWVGLLVCATLKLQLAAKQYLSCVYRASAMTPASVILKLAAVGLALLVVAQLGESNHLSRYKCCVCAVHFIHALFCSIDSSNIYAVHV